MSTHNTESRILAIAAGTIFTAGALGVLLEDVVMRGAPIVLKHGLTVIIVAGTMMVGHLCADAWRARRWLAWLGFCAVFFAGTGLTVYSSVGRQQETALLTAAQADEIAEARSGTKRALARAEAMLADAQAGLARECKTGKGKRCEGIAATIAVYEAAVKGHQADLAKMAPPKPVAVEADNLGEIAAVFGYDKAKIKAGAVLVIPFLTTLFLEFGAIVSFGYGFRSTGATRVTSQPRQPSATETMQTSFYADDTEATRAILIGGKNGGTDATDNRGNPNNGGGNRPIGGGRTGGNRQAFEADVLTRLALGQTIECQDDLAAAHGVHKGVVSKWLKDMRRRDLIPAAQRVGRCHRLVAAD